jgi:hypothetical protein
MGDMLTPEELEEAKRDWEESHQYIREAFRKSGLYKRLKQGWKDS